jgi:hypothetical protein
MSLMIMVPIMLKIFKIEGSVAFAIPHYPPKYHTIMSAEQ